VPDDLELTTRPTTPIDRPGSAPDPGMVWVSGGTFSMGSDDHYPEEAPAHRVSVGGFWIDRYAVTNRDFARFVRKTGYVTFAEQTPRAEDYPRAYPAMLVAGSSVFVSPGRPVDLREARLGRRDDARWAVDGQHLAGGVPEPEHR
jgi:formylglycine-generating enzyme